MRTRNSEVELTVKIPIGIPDLNGNIYTKEAIEKAVRSYEKVPITFRDTESKIVGITSENSPEIKYSKIDNTYYCTFKGTLFFTGVEGIINEMKDNVITDFTISGIGISI